VTKWIVIGALALANFVIKASGPVALGGRELSARRTAVIALLAPALLAALVMVETFASESELALDARAAGVAAAAGAYALSRNFTAAIVVAAAVAAGLRALT
jgi:branched-subunit amino acid transport protein